MKSAKRSGSLGKNPCFVYAKLSCSSFFSSPEVKALKPPGRAFRLIGCHIDEPHSSQILLFCLCVEKKSISRLYVVSANWSGVSMSVSLSVYVTGFLQSGHSNRLRKLFHTAAGIIL